MRGECSALIRWVCLGITIFGFALRLVVLAHFYGTSDLTRWESLAAGTATNGLIHTLRHDVDFNFPPMPVYLAATCWQTAQWCDVGFEKIFKLPMVLADVASTWLIWRIVARLRGERAAWFTATAFACNPLAIYVCAYHGNSDAIYSFLSLWAADLLLRNRPFASGLALGLAINVKLIPTLLIIPLALQCRPPGRAGGFIAGLAVSALPFIAVLIAAPRPFIEKVLLYDSLVEHWGVNFVLLELMHLPRLSAWIDPIVAGYSVVGKYVLFLAVTWLGLAARRRPVHDPLSVAALAAMLFLVITPGFGPQYLVFALPLMTVCIPRWAVAYGCIAGVAMSLGAWIENHHGMLWADLAAPRRLAERIGFISWLFLLAAVVRLFCGGMQRLRKSTSACG